MTSNTVVFVGSRIKKWCMFKTVMTFSVLCVISILFSAIWINGTNRTGPKSGNDVNEADIDMSSSLIKSASNLKSSMFRDNILVAKRLYHGDLLQNRKNAFSGTTVSDRHVHKNNRKNGQRHNKGLSYTGIQSLFGYKQKNAGNNIPFTHTRSPSINPDKRMWSNHLQYNRGEINITESNEYNHLEDWEINMLPSKDPCNIKSSEKIDPINLSRIKIGILIPSSTNNIQDPSLNELPLIRVSIPSLYKTFEKKYMYKIYVGVDKGDRLENFQDEIERMFDCVVMVYSFGKTFVQSVNTIAERAYNDGMDYLVRINDDTQFLTANWTSLAIEKLIEYVPQNIGVVGPTCNYGNVYILTHDMVHRTHLEIFSFYYPPYFENWWADDWITRVYEPDRSSKLQSWIVKHLIVKRRYTVDYEREKWVKTIIRFDKIRLWKYLGYS